MKRFALVGVTALLAQFFVQNLMQAAGYRIARQSDGTIQAALINNAGVVVFSALRRDPNSGKAFLGVYKGRGGDLRTVSEYPPFDPEIPGQVAVIGGRRISINSAGLVALYGTLNGVTGVFLGGGSIGPGDLIDDQLKFSPGSLLVTITDGGYLAYGGTIRGPFPDLRSSNPNVTPCTSCPGTGRLNSQNEALMFLGNGDQIARVRFGVISPSPGEQRLAPFATNVIVTVSPQTVTSGIHVMMNDNGSIAYADIKPDGTVGIYKNSGVPVVEQRAGSEFFFPSGQPNFAINNNDQVMFLAHSRTLGKTGFFRGSNPLTEKIVAEGDIVAGARLSIFSVPGEFTKESPDRWFNDAGQIVFQASDETGEDGLWVASSGISPPDPASAVVRWNPSISPPSGSFGATENWQPLNNDPPRVPQKTTTLNDTALFDRAETYMVDFGAQHAEGLIVKNGNVLFVNGSIKTDRLVAIDNAKLTLSTAMSLTNNDALIGVSAASRVDVGFGGDWVNLGLLRVGGPGEGILTINSGGEVTSGESRIGGAGGGHATIFGGGHWTTGDLALGIDGGMGELTITNGGNVASDVAFIGQESSLGNKVIVQGTSTTASSLWEVGILLGVGGAGMGQLEVKDGGGVDTLALRIAQKSGVSGSVTVSGVNADSTASKISAFGLTIGEAGVGELRIEDGGLVDLSGGGRVNVGGDGDGSLIVSGFNVNSDLPSELSLPTGELVIGPESGSGIGSMTIQGGAEVESGFSTVERGPENFPTEVKVIGSQSFWDAGSLVVGAGQNQGYAIVTLLGGEIAAFQCSVNARGLIRGFGTFNVPPAFRFTNSSGTISPGLSPGTLTINGSYEQQAGGRLLMEIGGTNSADCDHLIVTNAATLDGNLTFRFINGFTPKAGQQFDFLDVRGHVDGAFASIGLQNLAPGFQFNLVTNGSLASMTALNDGVFSTALPGRVQVSVTDIGGIAYATYIITASNTCQRIETDGSLTRTNNQFSLAFQGTTIVVGGDCAAQTTLVTNMIVLGALRAGDYSLQIRSITQVVDTVTFTVRADPEKSLLAPTRLVDGSLQFKVQGLGGVPYAIEASEDLKSWIPIGSGTLPDTFTDNDAAIFLTRFYRARIGP